MSKYGKADMTRMLTDIVALHQLTVFPTSVWLRRKGYGAIANAISRTGGYNYWAKALDLPMSDCETRIGIKYEQLCAIELAKRGLDVCKGTTKHPYDILTTAAVKIDVKGSHIYTAPDGSKFYSCNLEKSMPTADFFVLYCVGKNEEIEKIYILPDTVVSGKTQVSVGLKSSVYDKYINRWDLIEKLVDFKQKMR